MRILIACEESQAVCKEFRRLWHEAYSCDILPCSGGHPEWHIQWDAVKEAYSGKYDMMIAHPPCTYLSNAWARHLFPGKVLNQDRYKKWLEWKEVRKVFHSNEWWFVIVDAVGILTDSKDPSWYIKDMRRRDEDLSKGWGQIASPLSVETSGWKQKINCANTGGMLR